MAAFGVRRRLIASVLGVWWVICAIFVAFHSIRRRFILFYSIRIDVSLEFTKQLLAEDVY